MTGMILFLAVVLIMGGCAIYLFINGTFIKAFAMAIAAVCAGAVAAGFHGVLANTLAGFIGNSDLLSKWGPLLCFVVLFIVVFAILQTIISLLTRKSIDLGFLPESIGRAVCGVFLGFTLSRVLYAALIMSVLPGLQTSTLGKYLGYKGIQARKQTQQTRSDKRSVQSKPGSSKQSKTAPQKEKLSDTSRSVVGDLLDE
jgi:hypothetical protein